MYYQSMFVPSCTDELWYSETYVYRLNIYIYIYILCTYIIYILYILYIYIYIYRIFIYRRIRVINNVKQCPLLEYRFEQSVPSSINVCSELH